MHREDHIQGHFLISFIALTIMRILEKKLDYKYSSSQIKHSLLLENCKKIATGYYSLNPQDALIQNLEAFFGISLKYENIKEEAIKKYYKSIKHYIFLVP